MDFTEPYPHSQSLTLYSPNGKYLASYHLAQEGFTRLHPSAPIQPHEEGGRGVIIFRFAATMHVMRTIEIRLFRDSLPTISEIGWSPDSTMLLAACPITGTVLVYSVEEEEFKATITVPGIVSGSSPVSGGHSSNYGASGSGGNNNRSAVNGGSGQKKNNEASNSNSRQMQALKAMGYTPPGAEILRGVRFSADSRHILIWEEHLLRLSIWSLESTFPNATIPSLSPIQQQQQQAYQGQHTRVLSIQHPKAMSKSAVTSFSVPPYSTLGTTATSAGGFASHYVYCVRGDLQYTAVVERNGRECRDYVSIYATENYWTRPPIHTFAVEGGGVGGSGGIKDVEGIVWSPDGRYLVLWENPILDFKMAVYTMDGRCVGSYGILPETEGSSSDSQHSGPAGLSSGGATGGGGMGVKSVCWHPGSKLLALGGYDQKIRLLNHLTWKSILEFHHTAHIKYGSSTVLWRESESTVPIAGSVRVQGGIEYMIADQPTWIPTVRIDTQKPNAKIGVGWCDFNCDGTLLASRNDNMPNALWIWSMSELKPIVIIQQQSPVRVSRWDPNSPARIAWCCVGSGYVYSWRASSTIHGGVIEAVGVPAENFEVCSIKWCPDGKGLLLLDKNSFCQGFPIEEEEEGQYTIHENTASIFSRLR
ncbi:WD repeat-containing protein wrap73 [Mortierella claussenii]|nr:WD repeat-containing protein wrap73 [Mortierella claussenii]